MSEPTRATESLVYLDNAATTFPKPPEVLLGMVDAYARLGVSPGRGEPRSRDAG